MFKVMFLFIEVGVENDHNAGCEIYKFIISFFIVHRRDELDRVEFFLTVEPVDPIYCSIEIYTLETNLVMI